MMTLTQQLLKLAQEQLENIDPMTFGEMQECGYFANVDYDEFLEAVEKLNLPGTYPHAD